MRTIWKQPLELTAHQVIRTPGRSGLLCAKEQEGHEIHDMRKPIKHLDTVMVGKLVWHVYYLVYPKFVEVVARD